MLIDVAISADRNVFKKETEKILKYKDLTIKIQRMWNVKTKVIPVIIGATGTISKSFRKYVSNIPGKQEFNDNPEQNIREKDREMHIFLNNNNNNNNNNTLQQKYSTYGM